MDSLSYNQLVDLIKLLKGDKYPEKVIGNVQTALTNKVHLIKKIIIWIQSVNYFAAIPSSPPYRVQ